MAFLLPNLSPPNPLHQSKDKPNLLLLQQNYLSSHYLHLPSTRPAITPFSVLPKLDSSSPLRVAQLQTPFTAQENRKQQQQKDDFYVNLGLAVRTLREDMPLLFTKDLNYDIYRDDITFRDPMNTFTGIENYKLIFWALRFHGRILFREIGLEILRIWQPSDNVILIRWDLKGVPRVPWEAKGQFQGTSRYKLDRNGKIYEHKVDNLAFNFPQTLKPAVSVLDLVAASCPASPNPTFFAGPLSLDQRHSSSWVEFYRAVRETLDSETQVSSNNQLVTCS